MRSRNDCIKDSKLIGHMPSQWSAQLQHCISVAHESAAKRVCSITCFVEAQEHQLLGQAQVSTASSQQLREVACESEALMHSSRAPKYDMLHMTSNCMQSAWAHINADGLSTQHRRFQAQFEQGRAVYHPDPSQSAAGNRSQALVKRHSLL